MFIYLNVVAYSTHVILSRGDRLFQKVRAAISRREELWNVIRNDDEL